MTSTGRTRHYFLTGRYDRRPAPRGVGVRRVSHCTFGDIQIDILKPVEMRRARLTGPIVARLPMKYR